jgi:hypothetical protein
MLVCQEFQERFSHGDRNVEENVLAGRLGGNKPAFLISLLE